MTEPLFLCEMIWLAVWLVEWRGALNNDPPRAARLLCAASRWFSWQQFLRGMTAGSWPCWHGHPSASCSFAPAPSARAPSGSRALPWLRRRWSGSLITPSSSATGSISRAVPTPRQQSKYARRRPGQAPRIRAGTIPGFRCCFSSSAPRWTSHRNPGATSLLGARAAGYRVGLAYDASPGIPVDAACCGCRFPSTRTRLHSVRCLFFFPSGGRTPGTTRVMGWRCCRPSRSGLGFVAQFMIAAVREFKRNLVRCRGQPLSTRSLPSMHGQSFAIIRLTYVEGTKNIESRRAFEVEIPPVLRVAAGDAT